MTDLTDMTELTRRVLALSASERETLLARVDYENQTKQPEPTRIEAAVWDILCRLSPVVTHRSLPLFWHDKRRGVGRVLYGEAVEQLTRLAKETSPVRRPAQDEVALAELGLECLAEDMRIRRVEITPQTLIAALPRLRVAIDRCFPGYLEAKMLHRLIAVAA